MRRTLIIAGIVLVIIGIASYVVWAFTRPAPIVRGVPAEQGFFTRLFPFGNPAAPSAPGLGGSVGQQAGSGAEGPVPRLREVSDQPTAGGAVWTVGTTSVIRYIDRETGHLYETVATSPTATRISNTTIPGIEQVLWASPNDFIIRYLAADGTIENFNATVVPTTTEQALNGAFIGGFDRGVLDPAGKTLLTVTRTTSGATIAIGKPGTTLRTLMTSPIGSWVPLISNATTYLQSAPAAGIAGYMYQILGGTLTPVVESVPGLVALPSPSGRYVAISGGGQNTVALSILDTKTGTSYPSPLATIATKCVWTTEAPPTVVCGIPESLPTGNYPTDWLLGKISTTDDVWKITPVSGETTLLSNPGNDASASIDVWQMATDGTYVTFINKKDLTFWSLKISE